MVSKRRFRKESSEKKVQKRKFRKESSEKKVQKRKFRNKSLDQTETSPSQMLVKHRRDRVHGRKLVDVFRQAPPSCVDLS